MRKKTPLAQKKDDLHDLGSDDLLSRFSDDILVSILSYLPLKDAAVTSKLSRRWRYLWCHRVCLDFKDKERSHKLAMELCYLRDFEEWNKHINLCVERNKYVGWVNNIIRQHKSPTIDEFKICFTLDKYAKGALVKWIEFAISKNVQTLELDLRAGIIFRYRENYAFPNKIFDGKCESSLKRSSFNVPVRPCANSTEIRFLKALILKRVDVNDEDLKKILSNCPVLEHLSIHSSSKLVEVKINGKELALKTLEISFCDGLEAVEICDSNIVSIKCVGFDWDGVPISLRLDNLQKLEKMCISKAYSWKKINDMFCSISCCIPNLQVLELDLYHPQGATELLPYPELPQVKELIVNVERWHGYSLFGLTSLVEACPNLQRFKIQLMWNPYMRPINSYWEERHMAKQPHQHLEVVEICGYRGLNSDLELAMYFIKNVVALKRLVIQPFTIRERLVNEIVDEHAARYNAQQQLEPITPAAVELVISFQAYCSTGFKH